MGTSRAARRRSESAALLAGGRLHVLQACDARAEAHSLKDDLKPANFVPYDEKRGQRNSIIVKVLDFGISQYSRKGSDLLDLVTYGGDNRISALHV
jgi:hypothetical protein